MIFAQTATHFSEDMFVQKFSGYFGAEKVLVYRRMYETLWWGKIETLLKTCKKMSYYFGARKVLVY